MYCKKDHEKGKFLGFFCVEHFQKFLAISSPLSKVKRLCFGEAQNNEEQSAAEYDTCKILSQENNE